MKFDLTILTPTYNRAYILPQLYNSLCRQTNQQFIWLIVDDGSSDITCQLVNEWRTENLITIKYIYQANGGKHRAHNIGVKSADTELIMICDSDDYLVDDAVEKVLLCWAKEKNEKIGGIIAYRGQYVNNHLQKSKNQEFVIKEKISKVNKIFKVQQIVETTNIYRKDVLLENLFPEIDGEKFFPEIYVWLKIDMKYDVIILREILEIYEYLEDGYTKSNKCVSWITNCPTAYAMLFYLKFEMSHNIINKVIEYGKCRGLYYLYHKKEIPHKNIWWDIISFPVSIIAMKKYRS
ncbi:MAG: glycosyltransferase family 2 protein [Eubacterium sp.]|jgi:glycosyltransferase involved in cell wall biosynthesis|nr:glycosyltransferase family 2 protein [Eubacterium sp.]